MNKSLLSVMVLFFMWSLVVVLSGDSQLFKNTTNTNKKISTITKNPHTAKRRLCKSIAYRQAATTTVIKPAN